jgi:hypothetical protein
MLFQNLFPKIHASKGQLNDVLICVFESRPVGECQEEYHHDIRNWHKHQKAQGWREACLPENPPVRPNEENEKKDYAKYKNENEFTDTQTSHSASC